VAFLLRVDTAASFLLALAAMAFCAAGAAYLASPLRKPPTPLAPRRVKPVDAEADSVGSPAADCCRSRRRSRGGAGLACFARRRDAAPRPSFACFGGGSRPVGAVGTVERPLGRASEPGLGLLLKRDSGDLSTARNSPRQSRAESLRDSSVGGPVGDEADKGEARGELRVQKISGDGRCLFRAIAHSDAILTAGAPGPVLSAAAETRAADDLRACVVAELRKRADDLSPFIDEDFGSYCSRMARPGTWGGEPELSVAPHCIERPIQVYRRCPGGWAKGTLYGEEYAGGGKGGGVAPAMVLFDGFGHYELLYHG